jgi:hypothetical protein
VLRPRPAREGQADARVLASAISVYTAVAGTLPAALSNLTSVITNVTPNAGPFVASVPTPPAGWSAYTYTPVATAGTFTISANGDGTSVLQP